MRIIGKRDAVLELRVSAGEIGFRFDNFCRKKNLINQCVEKSRRRIGLKVGLDHLFTKFLLTRFLTVYYLGAEAR